MIMKSEKDLREYKKRYHLFRHHAWAGLGFLSVILALRILFQDLLEMLEPLIILLIIYVVIALLFTYKYRLGLSSEQEIIHSSDELEKEKIHADLEKKRLKLEKKKAKAETKAQKKAKK